MKIEGVNIGPAKARAIARDAYYDGADRLDTERLATALLLAIARRKYGRRCDVLSVHRASVYAQPDEAAPWAEVWTAAAATPHSGGGFLLHGTVRVTIDDSDVAAVTALATGERVR